jgi:hypothetical protein
MGAASHLGIDLREYDARIRTFTAPLQAADRRAWLAHLERRYTAKQSAAYLRAWAKDDHYQRLVDEGGTLEGAGFAVDLAWRRGSFAVVAGTKLK